MTMATVLFAVATSINAVRKAMPNIPPRFDPSVEDSRAFADGRMLVLSSFPPEVPVSPISRENCQLMNARILRLCGPAAEAIDTSKDGGLRPPSPPVSPPAAATGGPGAAATGGSGAAATGGSGAEPPSFENQSMP